MTLAPRILIVEDSIVSWVMMEAHIKRKKPDYDVRVRHSLRGAREEFASFKPDLVILDLSLPDSTDGVAALAYISELRAGGACVLAVSGHLDMKDRALQAGADDFAGKTVGESAQPFMERVNNLISQCTS